MARRELTAAVHEEDGAAVIALSGDVDSGGEQVLTAAYAEATRRRPHAVSLDFAAVEYVNSTGIALIVGLLAQARAQRVAISASGLTPHYREIFEITRLADFMTIIPSEPGVPSGAGGTDSHG